MRNEIAPVHPGEILMEDFLVPLGVTQHRLAVSIGVPARRINETFPASGESGRTSRFA